MMQMIMRLPRKTVPFFLLLLALALAAQSLFWTIYYLEHVHAARSLLTHSEAEGMKREKVVLEGMLQQVVSDLRALSDFHTVRQYFTGSAARDESDIKTDLRSFVVNKRIYDQVRLLDAGGMERVRINHIADGSVAVVPHELLQDKAERYYFKHGYPLARGQVYISALDLNVENGEIERPFKPTLRMATPVFDDAGNKQGVVVLNMLAENLFEAIEREQAGMSGSVMLINQDGYWLKGVRPEDEWGFMLPDRQQATFARDFPEAAVRVREAGSGQFETAHGLFTFARVPLVKATVGQGFGVVTDQPYWTLVSLVPRAKLAAMQQRAVMDVVLYSAPTTLLIVLFAWLLALDRKKRLQAVDELARLAERDGLTGLLNRLALSRRLQEELARARRYKLPLSLLLLDVDHFKRINDQYGHPAGDACLIALAELMQGLSRQSDIIGRYGGEEFMLLLPHTNLQQAELFAERLRSGVERLEVPTASGDLFMTVSIGVAALAEGAAMDMDEATLVHEADTALYAAKGGGRNRVCIAGGEEDGRNG